MSTLKINVRETRRCRNNSVKETNKLTLDSIRCSFLGDEFATGEEEECYSETDELGGGDFDFTNITEFKDSKEFVDTEPDPIIVIKTNRIITNCLKKLQVLQAQEDAKRFSCRIDDVPSDQKSKCCFHTSTEYSKCSFSYGPFISCPIRHSRSHDFKSFIKPFQRSKNQIGIEDEIKPSTKKVIGIGWKGCTGKNEFECCRKCPKSSIHLPDSDMWYQDYKYRITYGRIPPSLKAKLKEKYLSWISTDDYKGRVNWNKNKAVLNNKFPHSGNILMTQRLSPSGSPVASPRRSVEATTPKFGPWAIAAVSTYGFRRGRIITQAPQDTNSSLQKTVNVPQQQQQQQAQENDGIPLPADNIRYYDDDFDPRIIELLSKVPLLVKNQDTTNSSPIGSKANNSCLFSKSKEE